jgi:hypothetical protein
MANQGKLRTDCGFQAVQGAITPQNFPVKVIDNSHELGHAILYEDREAALQYLQKQQHDEVQLLGKLRNETLGLYEQGKIPEHIAIGLVGERAVNDRRLQLRSAQGVPGGGGANGPGAGGGVGGAKSQKAAHGGSDSGGPWLDRWREWR